MKMNGVDVTDIIGPYVNSIKVKNTTLPSPKNSDKDSAPTEATIDIISKDYMMEDLFIEGTKIKIYMGYDRLLPETELVFSGTIMHLPDGEAQELLKYSVIAYGDGIELAGKEKSRSFLGKKKHDIVYEIVSEYDLVPTIDIADFNVIKGKYAPTQIAESDLVLLQNFAKDWNCTMWFDFPNLFYFVDSDKVHSYKEIYTLGYKTDKVACNVEKFSWKHEPSRIATVSEPGLLGYGEGGVEKGIEEFKIQALGATWKLKPKYLKDAKTNPGKFGEYLAVVGAYTFSWNAYTALRKYYEIVNYDDSTSPHVPPAGDNSGLEISVTLNDGDPKLSPPFHALLYSGSINPRAVSSNLPEWLRRYGDQISPAIKLNVNETVLTYEQGRLVSELKCSVGAFEI
jgi:hypothetical protein